MSAAPLISVLMPVFNLREYLPEAVASIQAQTLKDWEFIIVDDGSTDGSSEWLDKAAASDPRLRVVHQANAGISKALNAGLRLCRGTYVARMDGDDICLPERFARQVAALEADPGLAIVGAGAELMSADGLVYGKVKHFTDHDRIRASLLMGNGGALTHPVVMMRREALDAIGGYDEELVTFLDLDLFLRISEQGRAANLPEVLIRYRQHPKSDNHLMHHTWREMRRKAVLKALRRLGDEAFVEQLFPLEGAVHTPRDPLVLARVAERNGRPDMAVRYARRAWSTPGTRLGALKYLTGLNLRRAIRFLD